ncbi:MAG: hypothetical protein ACFCU4_06510 [Puniceicoccaceae bacterium]
MKFFNLQSLELSPKVQLLPSEAFYVDVLKLPQDLSLEETFPAARLAISAASPYPEDRLASGFYPLGILAGQHYILLYAASIRRLEALGHPINPEADWVIPAFLPAALFLSSEDQEQVVYSREDPGYLLARRADDLQVFLHPPSWPAKFLRETLREEKLPIPFDQPTARDLSLSLTRVDKHWQLRNLSGAEPTLLIPPSHQKVSDCRGEVFVGDLWLAERRSSRIQRISKVAFALLLLCALLQVLLVPISRKVESLEELRLEKEEQIAAMDTRRDLVLRLEGLADGSARPLRILAFANQYRPDSIEWDEAFVKADGTLELEGRAPDIRTVNTYAESLRQSGHFLEVRNEATAREGRIAFSINLVYAEQPESLLDPAPPSDVSVEDSEAYLDSSITIMPTGNREQAQAQIP